MSPKDLCTLPILDRILASGASILKIEGRGRPADYVAAVTKVYRQAIDKFVTKGHIGEDEKKQWQQSLNSVFNRGFWDGGYYLGEKVSAWSKSGDNQAFRRKKQIGKIVNYFRKAKVAEAVLLSGKLLPRDQIVIIGPSTGAVELLVDEIRKDDEKIDLAIKGDRITFPCPEKLRPNDELYRFQSIHLKDS